MATIDEIRENQARQDSPSREAQREQAFQQMIEQQKQQLRWILESEGNLVAEDGRSFTNTLGQAFHLDLDTIAAEVRRRSRKATTSSEGCCHGESCGTIPPSPNPFLWFARLEAAMGGPHKRFFEGLCHEILCVGISEGGFE